MDAPASILVVDDEVPQMTAICDTLNDQGYLTTGCSSAAQALAQLDRGRFDLLITDLMMPGMDGIALLRAALPRDPLMVGIVMTGAGTIATAVEAMKAGALDYILKPFRLSAILPVLERALTVRRLRHENAELMQRLEARTTELEQANRELEAFSYSVSHDLGAPARRIAGFVNLLQRQHQAELSADAQELLGFVSGNAKLMGQLIDGLLRLSRLGRQELARVAVDVDGLARAVADEQLRENEGRDLQIAVGTLPPCTGDPALLRQVLTNLLSNACKYSRNTPQARIAVSFSEAGNERIYTIADNGAGFDMAGIDRLFGVFKRLHRDDQFEGTGIGLSIVRRIIERHGGRIWAEAEVGRGATFRFTLPAAEPAPG